MATSGFLNHLHMADSRDRIYNHCLYLCRPSRPMVCITGDPHHPTDAYATCGHHHHGGRLHSHFGRPHHHPTALKEADCRDMHHGCETHTHVVHTTHPKVYRFVGQGEAAANKRRHPRYAKGQPTTGVCGPAPPHHHDACGRVQRHAGHRDANGQLQATTDTYDQGYCAGSDLYAPHVPCRATLLPPTMPAYAPTYTSKRCKVCRRCRAHDELDYYCGASCEERVTAKGWKLGTPYEPRMRGF